MKTVGKQLVGVTANEHLVEIEKGQLDYDIAVSYTHLRAHET